MKRRYSLKRNKEFRYVYKTGKSVACRSLVIVYRKNNTGLLHVGFSVGKRIGGSVTRNLIKRRLRSAFDTILLRVNPNYSMIVIARRPVLEATYAEICESFNYMLNKAGLLLSEQNNKIADDKGD